LDKISSGRSTGSVNFDSDKRLASGVQKTQKRGSTAIFQDGCHRYLENQVKLVNAIEMGKYRPIWVEFDTTTRIHMLSSKNAKAGSSAIFQDGGGGLQF
jgi:hypothetical protein